MRPHVPVVPILEFKFQISIPYVENGLSDAREESREGERKVGKERER